MWEFYLATSEISFRHLNSVVFQIQLAKRRDAVPQTRGYLFAAEQALVEEERQRAGLRLVERAVSGRN